MSSKESLEKREKIESAFRECKEAFLEVSMLVRSLEETSNRETSQLNDIKKEISLALDVNRQRIVEDITAWHRDQCNENALQPK